MAYKSLLTVVTDPDLLKHSTLTSAAFAEGHSAHLEVLCLGVDRSQTGYYYAGANATILQQALERTTETATALAKAAHGHLSVTSGRWGVSEDVAQMVDIGRLVAAHARFSDATLLPLPYGKERGAELEPVLEAALFQGQCPVIVMPDATRVPPTPKRIAIGWNESAEALRAIRAALPLLISADLVHIVVIDPPQHGPNRSDPGGQLSEFLARHGVKAEVDVLSKALPRVSDVLQRHVVDVDAEMIVMGAYGHSRFRESILGGATRNMLQQAKVPVFMAH